MVAQLPDVAVSLAIGGTPAGNGDSDEVPIDSNDSKSELLEEEEEPIQIAAYYKSADDAAWVRQQAAMAASESLPWQTNLLPQPYAISFQAHPEYATEYSDIITRSESSAASAVSSSSSLATNDTNASPPGTSLLSSCTTLDRVLDAMTERGGMSVERRKACFADAQQSHRQVRDDSVHVIMVAGRLLGWFPTSP